jgi:O-antigen ligase
MQQRSNKVVFLAAGIMMVIVSARAVASVSIETGILSALALLACIIAIFKAEISVHFLIFAMLLSPELAVGDTAGGTLNRSITLRPDDILLVLITVIWFVRSAIDKVVILRRTPLNSAIFFYCVACILSTMVGIYDGRVQTTSGMLFVLKYIEYFLIFWMVINTTYSEGQVRRYLAVLFLVGIIVSFIGMSQMRTGERVSAPFEGETGEPNTFGGYLLFLLSLALGVTFASRKYRLQGILVIAVLTSPFLFTLSRASYLGFIPMIFLITILSGHWVRAVWVPLIILLIVLFPSLMPRAVVDRVAFTFNQSARLDQYEVLGQRLDTSTSVRLFAFTEAGQAFSEKPVLGWGVTGWHFIDSMYFRTLVETGLVGISAFLLLMVQVLRQAWRTRSYFRNRDPLYFGLASGFIAGTIGLLFHAVGSNTFIIVRIMEPYWLCCALIYILPHLTAQSETCAA